MRNMPVTKTNSYDKQSAIERHPNVENERAVHNAIYEFDSRLSKSSTMSSDSDYRVTSMHEKPKPGRLTDFIPEVERNPSQAYNFHDKERKRNG